MVKKEYICIVCPNSCTLEVTDDNGKLTVEGARCKLGISHGKKEYTNPERMLTSTINITGGIHKRLPIISVGEIPKDKIKECLEVLYSKTVKAPVKCEDIIEHNICGTGVDIVASRSMKARD